ncbi:hypothetical protein DFH07DRAFT_999857 [Mycena maculata]|uniref:Uncharacterized protein n=1 Tax=Mycena maculata TaxID=230809 RepID=A0AAD7HU02_9AGAR|nr:hypothetical protein DFH07DRAFT_999857 [Mycena maculata]
MRLGMDDSGHGTPREGAISDNAKESLRGGSANMMRARGTPHRHPQCHAQVSTFLHTALLVYIQRNLIGLLHLFSLVLDAPRLRFLRAELPVAFLSGSPDAPRGASAPTRNSPRMRRKRAVGLLETASACRTSLVFIFGVLVFVMALLVMDVVEMPLACPRICGAREGAGCSAAFPQDHDLIKTAHANGAGYHACSMMRTTRHALPHPRIDVGEGGVRADDHASRYLDVAKLTLSSVFRVYDGMVSARLSWIRGAARTRGARYAMRVYHPYERSVEMERISERIYSACSRTFAGSWRSTGRDAWPRIRHPTSAARVRMGMANAPTRAFHGLSSWAGGGDLRRVPYGLGLPQVCGQRRRRNWMLSGSDGPASRCPRSSFIPAVLLVLVPHSVVPCHRRSVSPSTNTILVRDRRGAWTCGHAVPSGLGLWLSQTPTARGEGEGGVSPLVALRSYWG